MSHFARSSLIVAFFFGIDKVLAFVRQLIITRQFGLSYELDAFNAANNVPDLLGALISGGALGVALIPVLSEYLETKGRKDAWELFARVLNLAFLVTGAIALVVLLIAPWLVSRIIAPGFPANQQALTVELMRLDLIAIMIFSLSGLVMAGLQANQHFLLPALAPALYNVGQIFGAAYLAPEGSFELGPIALPPGLGFGIHGLVYGVILGAALHLLIQVPGLMRYGFRWAPVLGLRAPGMNKVLKLLGPRVLTKFFIFMFFIVRDNLASGMGEGAVTALNLGWFIMQVPETLLGTAVAITLLPTISELIAREDFDGFRDAANQAVRGMLALTIPAAILLAIGVRPLVDVAFGFEPEGVDRVVLATRIYLMGMTGHALLEIASRSFYARQDAITPLWAAALNAGSYVVLALILASTIGFAGIALANSIVFTTEAILLLWLLNRHYPGLLRTGNTFIRVTLASTAAGIGLFLVMRFVEVNLVILSLGSMLLGLVLVFPFIWPELRLMLKLGSSPKPEPIAAD
ncbi:MAG: murein biosynthesis integral membrane protein MurJ [Chloroflexi bacterium]|nr:MAG: murein biosynthesis integral membrane protein MurJ [Chloroflexota bacterium]MBL1194669.1 murein biosynthesis integral membrane protein MurJ [Chloroflexota bacterium]NOH11960.1 murein biosynthesis integral membrane protein MurJ [Chloroflexota bacterium]